jgi:hypothetical protein
VKHPLRALKVFLKGIETEKPMVPEISLDNQRPAELVFENLVERMSERLEREKAEAGTNDSDRAA